MSAVDAVDFLIDNEWPVTVETVDVVQAIGDDESRVGVHFARCGIWENPLDYVCE